MGDGLPDGMTPGMLSTVAQNFDVDERLREDLDSVGTSPAGMLADVVNVMRADIKMLADVHGVEVSVDQMTEDRAAEVLSGLMHGDATLVEIFNEMAHKRQQIVLSAVDQEAAERYLAGKRAVMNSADPETWDAEE